MKTITMLVCLALCSLVEAREKTFHVSSVGEDKAKLLDVFDKVKQLEGGNDASFTQAKFIEELKAGEIWVLKNYETQKCFYCFGKGHQGPLRDNKKCEECKGKGMETIDLLVKW